MNLMFFALPILSSPLQTKASVFFGYPNTFWIVAEAPLVQDERQRVDAGPQIGTDRISGRVLDPLGDPISGQPVQLKVARSLTAPAITRTDSEGRFSFDAVRGTSYEVLFEVPGFSRLAVPVKVSGSGNGNIGTVRLRLAPIGDPIEVQTYLAPVSDSLDSTGRGTEIRGRYTNVDYGFRIDIPAGLVGEGNVPPAPNHGFAIDFGESSLVLVDATYEMPDSPHTFRRFNARLGKLKAERKSWSETDSGIEVFHESIIARGFDRQAPIIYTIKLDTTAEHRSEGLRVFEALRNSFRTIPVRP